MASNRTKPLIWYMTQAYAIRGGHEAHVLHFATELRNHGFNTRVVVLEELPREEHLFMRLLRERGIPLSAVRRTRAAGVGLAFALVAPVWGAWMRLRGHQPRWDRLRNYLADRPAKIVLRGLLQREKPAVIHIMGSLAPYAWALLPADRCVLHHGTEGRRDDTWEPVEFEAFRAFAGRAARNFAPGSGVIANLRQEFGITRPIDSVFTICPDQCAASLESTALPQLRGGCKTVVPAPCAGFPADAPHGGATTVEAPRVTEAVRPPAQAPPPLRGGGTETPAVVPAPNPPLRFGILCRMTPEKGLHVLLEALRAYQAQHATMHFVFAGRGVLEEELRAYVAKHGLDGVTFQPEFTSAVDVLRTFDVFVHPSLSDAMPLAIAEALMCGLPCIVTRVGGIPDLVRDEQEGLLVPPGEPMPIVAAMTRFQTMPAADRLNFGQRARMRYEAVCRPASVGAVIAAHYRAVMTDTQRAA